ncbi:hypothetical protein [Actinomadura atramentaria]|uniref:hypothetical protein n=1 Tax=Actinomadura atramentaria TaxID=1990 RepID=UPI0012F9CB1A|nr:hypothetical protein [Actinomadura atramentaria]
MDTVRQLIDLAKAPSGEMHHFDWHRVEESIGLALPEDYKSIVDGTVDGFFQGVVRVGRPGGDGYVETDFLGYYAHLLDDLRVSRGEGNAVPYPIFPEVGGLLPWGIGPGMTPIFWRTDDVDPNNWTVVVADSTFENWCAFAGGVAEFLTVLVNGRTTGTSLDAFVDFRAPAFVPMADALAAEHELYANESVRQGDDRVRDPFWRMMRVKIKPLVDDFINLKLLLGEHSVVVPPIEWDSIESALGAQLPGDYKKFAEFYGPGDLCGLRIATPQGAGDYSLADLVVRKYREAVARERSDLRMPIFPEPEGAIPWGESVAGHTIFWVPVGGGPESWIVGSSTSYGNAGVVTTYQGCSFSTFVLKQIDGGLLSPIDISGQDSRFHSRLTGMC